MLDPNFVALDENTRIGYILHDTCDCGVPVSHAPANEVWTDQGLFGAENQLEIWNQQSLPSSMPSLYAGTYAQNLSQFHTDQIDLATRYQNNHGAGDYGWAAAEGYRNALRLSQTVLLDYFLLKLPEVAKANGPYVVNANGTLHLNSSGSYDPDGDVFSSIAWDLNNDGTYDVFGANPSVSYNDLTNVYHLLPGVHTIRLRVVDDNRTDAGMYGEGFDTATLTIVSDIMKTLTVVSAHGGASPETLTTNCYTALSLRVTNSPVAEGSRTQYVCSSGTVASNSFTQVSATNVTLALTNDATLTWNWQTQYQLATETNGNGSVAPAAGWYAEGSNVVLTATAGFNWHFSRWEGDTNGCEVAGNTNTAPMTQARTIRAVFEIDQKTLTVNSAHGGDWPGTLTTNYNTFVEQFINNSPVAEGSRTQYVCLSGTMASNSFAQVTPTNVTLTLTNDATLTWNWQTQYWLDTGTNGNGSVDVVGHFVDSGSNVTITATPAVNHHFANWTGDIGGADPSNAVLTVTMDQARVVTANFAINLPSIWAAFDGTNLDLSWPADYVGWELQGQTNSLNAGLGADWFPVPGSTNNTHLSIPIDPACPSAFYRLRQP